MALSHLILLCLWYSVYLPVANESLAEERAVSLGVIHTSRNSNIYRAAESTCTDLWFIENNGTCECGNSIHDVVICNEYTKEIAILDCYCMTTDPDTNVTVVGDCLYNCGNVSHNVNAVLYHRAPSNCSSFHRRGTLCGKCEANFFPIAYTYDIDCVECNQPNSWWLYITAAFLPMTVFIAVIFLCRINVVSPKLHVFIFLAQILAAPINVRAILLATKYSPYPVQLYIRVLATIYGVWNLDFFRTLMPGICLQLPGLQVLVLDYLIAVYPMLLMLIVYTLVSLHGYGFRLVSFLWRPFHYVFARFRRQWDIQTSIVDAFATFFLLSITKLLDVSFAVILPIKLHVLDGNSLGLFLYYAPHVEFMSTDHLPYALLAITVMALFIFLPSFVLLFSSFHCLRGCTTIRIFNDFVFAFQKYYKDGTNGTRDCRWYAAGCYIFISFHVHIVHIFTLNSFTYLYAIFVYTSAALIVLIVEPYKEEYDVFNVIECLQFLWLALLCTSITLYNLSGLFQHVYLLPSVLFLAFVSITPFVYIIAIFLQWFLYKTIYKKCPTGRLESSLPHRISHSYEYR